METNAILLFVIVLISLIAFYNGCFINWKYDRNFRILKNEKLWYFGKYYDHGKAWSKLWHSLGVLIRVWIVLFYIHLKGLSADEYFNISFLAVICYPVWDIIIALSMQQKWYYTGTTSSVDKLPDLLEYFFKILFLCNLIGAWLGFNLFAVLNF